jgi:hypothetical protein
MQQSDPMALVLALVLARYRNMCEKQSDILSELAFYGLPVYADNRFCTDRVQFRYPRSKKKRIRRKWAKNPRNYHDVPSNTCVVIHGKIYMHPEKLKQLADDASGALARKMEVVILSDSFGKYGRLESLTLPECAVTLRAGTMTGQAMGESPLHGIVEVIAGVRAMEDWQMRKAHDSGYPGVLS